MSSIASPFADLSGLKQSAGNHFSHFYEDAADLADAVVPFMAQGLIANERCLWVTCTPMGSEAAFLALARLVPDLAERQARGQIQIIGHDDWYRAAGGFNAYRVIAGWLDKEKAALADGYAGLRITGNTFWVDTPDDFTSFADYERRLHQALKGRRITCLCSYCLKTCPGSTILDVINSHEFTVARRNGDWQIVESASLKATKAELTDALMARDRLLTEIHHRVKNNLQIVSSFLTLKAPKFGGPHALEAVDDTITRIRAMSLVHELLYQQEGRGIDFSGYLRQLAEVLRGAYDLVGRIDILVEEDGQSLPLLDIDTAVPLGIAASEAVTNAFKHAFPDGRRGCITLSLGSDGQTMRVAIADDGVGLPIGHVPRGGSGIGLMRGLSAQVGGSMEILHDLGCAVVFLLPVPTLQ